MKRASYSERGPVPQDVISAEEFSTPALAEGEALVEVLAAPINPSDVLTLTGLYGMLPPLPAVGGNEGVGRVVELGPNTDKPAVGQTVLLPIGCGSWASHIVAPAKRLIALPNDADPQQLAMMTVNPPTALLMLREFVDLEPGDWVMQNVANSGVGSYLIQIAAMRGLKTVNVVRRESAVQGVKDMGGDVVLVDGEKLGKRVAEATGGAAIKLGIDAVGGSATDRLAGSLAEGGVLVNYGMMGGEPCEVSPASFVFRDITLRGFWLSKWYRSVGPEQQQAVFSEIAKGIGSGKLHAKIDSTYPIEEIKKAVEAAAAGERDGKILVVPKR
jgi:NADPH:quinone reductase-like Zn-dependent oxidoreductase